MQEVGINHVNLVDPVEYGSRRISVAEASNGSLLDSDQLSQRAKTLVADPADDDQIFSTPKRSESLAMLNDSFGQALSDSRQRFQLVC